jgi:hypothetical protein
MSGYYGEETFDDSQNYYQHPNDAQEAREEIQDAYVEAGGPGGPGGYSQGSSGFNSFAQSFNQQSVFEQSFAGFADSDSDDETHHTRLFAIIEEGMPRPNERIEAKERIQITEMTFERIRRWLQNHPDLQQRAEAVAVRGNNDATPLHNVCKLNNPPPEILEAFVEAVPESASWQDTHGWLPLHHACANGASGAVLSILVEAFPDGKVCQDSQNRTPLHFFLTQRCDNPVTMAENMELLLDTGAAELPDVGGMLPMHYACAYGVSPIVLLALARVYPDSLISREKKGRTPMHLAMVNAHHEASPGVIHFLLESCGPEIVNVRDHDGYLPLHLLALGLRGFRSEGQEQKNSVGECLTLYLGAEPHASADFLTALQDLPDWLQDVAVVTPHVRNILNKKIVQRFPTSILMLDGYMLGLVIVCFELTSMNHIDYRFAGDPLDTGTALSLLYIGASYFLVRELVQIISLWSLGSLSAWFWDPTNWLDMSVIILVFYYAVCMTDDSLGISDEAFRTGLAFTKGVLWISFISFLKSTLVEFSVFVGGVYYVLKRLAAFLMAVSIILLAFAQMFFIVYTKTDICDFTGEEVANGQACYFPYCKFRNSLLKVYTMMMGQVGDVYRYNGSIVAQILYVMYSFLVIILLSNVLIAIVTDSYEIVQNDRAAIVFWSNRLDFVAEMDAISYGIRNRLGILEPRSGGMGHGREGPPGSNKRGSSSKRIFADAWRNLVQLFDQHLYDDIDFHPSNVDFWCFFLFRALAIVFIIPLWIGAGIVTAGWLWPPQIREWLFIQRETTVSRADIEKQKLNQLIEIQNNIKSIKTDIRKELSSDRDEITRMKNQIEAVQGRIASDLQQVRELMTTLLDMGRSQSSFRE